MRLRCRRSSGASPPAPPPRLKAIAWIKRPRQQSAPPRRRLRNNRTPRPRRPPSGRPPPVAAEPRAPTDAVRERCWRGVSRSRPEGHLRAVGCGVLLDRRRARPGFVERRHWEPTVEPGTGAVRVPA